MSQVLEFQGKSIDAALEQASEALNLPANKLNYEVLDYGSSGIFGLVGVKKAKIKVYVPRGVQVEAEAGGQREVSPERQDRRKPTPPEEAETPIDPEMVQYGVDALQRIADSLSQGASVQAEQRGEKIYYTLSGGESGVLIGKRGQTLEAIQYLLEKMVNKKCAQRVRVVVDVEGYLEKRKSNLQQMALRMAEKARRTKKPVTIGQMNSHDRRIIHIQLKDEKGVRTQSIGDGYYRKLMIFPKKGGGTRRPRRDNQS